MKKALCWTLSLLGFATVVQAEDYYYGDFSGSSSAALHGAAPDIRPGSQVWTAKTDFKQDGSYTSTAANGRAYLPLTIEAGKIYTVSADVDVKTAATASSWLGLGFASSGGTTLAPLSGGIGTLYITKSGTLRGYSTNSVQIGTGLGTVGTNGNLKLVLTTYTDATPWNIDYYYNDTWKTNFNLTATLGSTISQVMIGGGGATAINGTFDQFKVSVGSAEIRRLKLFVVH
jgi:hypothetical protein